MGQIIAAVNAIRKHTRCGNFHKKDECKAVRNKCFNCNKVENFAKMCRFKGQSKSSYKQQKKPPLKYRKNTANVHLVRDDGQNFRTAEWETANQVFEVIAWTG